jgi:hypothetical protein
METLRMEINRLDSLRMKKTVYANTSLKTWKKINVVTSFLPDYTTEEEKRDYLKSLISTPGMFHHCIFANNTKYLLIFFLLPIIKPAQKHICIIVEQPSANCK